MRSHILLLIFIHLVLATSLLTRDIASCEVSAAADQVACTQACNGDASCTTACAATAVQSYTSCAGVKRDTASCEDAVEDTEEDCIDACPTGSKNTSCVLKCAAAASQGYVACED